jgi:hypothetical protein
MPLTNMDSHGRNWDYFERFKVSLAFVIAYAQAVWRQEGTPLLLLFAILG